MSTAMSSATADRDAIEAATVTELEGDKYHQETAGFLAYSKEPESSTSWAARLLERWSSIASRIPRRMRWILALIPLFVLLSRTFSSRSTLSLPITRTSPGTAWKGFANIDHLFVFGDSWSMVNDPLDGADVPTKPLEYSTWHEDNASKWIHYLSFKYNHSRLETWDYARGKAVVDYDFAKTENSQNTFAHQVQVDFAEHWLSHNGDAPIHFGYEADKTLFAAFFGINDIWGGAGRPDKLAGLLTTYEMLLEQLYSNAAARNFLVINCIPIESTPLYHTMVNMLPSNMTESVRGYAEQTVVFNEQLSEMVARLQSKYTDITVFEFDLYSWMKRVLEYPRAYPQTEQLSNTTFPCLNPMKLLSNETFTEAEESFCAGSGGDHYLWKDNLHVRPPFHDGMAKALEQLLIGGVTRLTVT